MVFFVLVTLGVVCGFIGGAQYDAGAHRFRLLQWAGFVLVIAGAAVYFRNEFRRRA